MTYVTSILNLQWCSCDSILISNTSFDFDKDKRNHHMWDFWFWAQYRSIIRCCLQNFRPALACWAKKGGGSSLHWWQLSPFLPCWLPQLQFNSSSNFQHLCVDEVLTPHRDFHRGDDQDGSTAITERPSQQPSLAPRSRTNHAQTLLAAAASLTT